MPISIENNELRNTRPDTGQLIERILHELFDDMPGQYRAWISDVRTSENIHMYDQIKIAAPGQVLRGTGDDPKLIIIADPVNIASGKLC